MVDVAAEAANDPGREDGPAIDMDLSPKKQDGLQTPSSTHSTAAPDSPWGHGTMSSTSDSMMMDYQSEIPLAPLQERSSSAGSGRPRATQKKPKRQNQPGSIGCIGCTSPTQRSLLKPNLAATLSGFYDPTAMSPRELRKRLSPFLRHSSSQSPAAVPVTLSRAKAMQTSKSSPGLGPLHPMRQPLPYNGPEHPFVRVNDANVEVDRQGYPLIQVFPPDHKEDWDERHQLLVWVKGQRGDRAGRKVGDIRPDNQLLPKDARTWCGPPNATTQSELPKLQEHLGTLRHGPKMMARMQPPPHPPTELRHQPGTPMKLVGWAADVQNSRERVSDNAGPTEKYKFGGTMSDRDGKVRLWNERWHKDMASMNEGLHKSHRQYFVQQSLYNALEKQIVFEPGAVGLKLAMESGVVLKVEPGSQAHQLGVIVGSRCLSVAGKPFLSEGGLSVGGGKPLLTKADLLAAESGTETYEAVFMQSAAQAWRRYGHQEGPERAQWSPMTMKKPPIFGTLGC